MSCYAHGESQYPPKDEVHARCVESALTIFPTSVRCCVEHSNHQWAPVVPDCVSTVRRIAPCTELFLFASESLANEAANAVKIIAVMMVKGIRIIETPS